MTPQCVPGYEGKPEFAYIQNKRRHLFLELQRYNKNVYIMFRPKYILKYSMLQLEQVTGNKSRPL